LISDKAFPIAAGGGFRPANIGGPDEIHSSPWRLDEPNRKKQLNTSTGRLSHAG